MAGTKEATTMSVREMREHLGIKKTESYWLINKRYFDTVTIAGRTRVVKVSFEEWYAGQTHYRKVTGEEPGAKRNPMGSRISLICLGLPRAAFMISCSKRGWKP